MLGHEVDIRRDLREILDHSLRRMARPGTWWEGAQRVGMAVEARAARHCELCRARREAVSPYAVSGAHDAASALGAPEVDAIHRIASDPGRLTPRWHREVVDAGIGDERLVELIAVVATVAAIDTFFRAIGKPAPDLPPAESGSPTREHPGATTVDDAWVPTLPPERATGTLAAVYRLLRPVPGIFHALSLVPDEQVAFIELSAVMYVPPERLYEFDWHRQLQRPQMEVVSTTVSAANNCFY